MRRLIFAVAAGLLALALVFVTLSRSEAISDPVDLVLTSPYAGGEVTVGDTVRFTALLTNVDAISRTFVYALSIPQGTVFVAASGNLQRNSYPVGAADTTVKSLTWNGQLEPQQRQTFTFTMQITAAGTLPGGDIPVTGLVFDVDSGEELSRETVTLDWPGATLYLPVITRNSGPPTTPTPSTPTPTPLPSTGQFTATLAGMLQSQATAYDAALAGSGYVAGNEMLYDQEPYQYPFISLSLVQCNFMELVYMVHRTYVEYDTGGIGEFGSAYLVFRNNTAYPGPPAHSVEVYQGTWTQLLSETHQIDPANWDAQGALIATVPGNTGALPVTATVAIPAGYVNPGGVTRFALKTSTEGNAPPLNSCFGGPNPGLGASVSLPYLYIQP